MHKIPPELFGKVKETVAQNPQSFQDDNWIRLIPHREKTIRNINHDASINEIENILTKIIQNLLDKAQYKEFLGKRLTSDSYGLTYVQPLVDFAYAMLYKYENLKQSVIDNNLAQYNPKTGEFELIVTKKE